MAHLDWKSESLHLRESEAKFGVSGGVPAKFERLLELGVSAAQRAALFGALVALKSKEGSELRLELPQGWTIFWKLREGESRLFLAHPDHDSWVATLSLTAEHLAALLQAPVESAIGLSSLAPISRMSNFELVVVPPAL